MPTIARQSVLLPAADGADHRHRFTRRDVETDVFQHEAIPDVDAEVLDLNSALRFRHRQALRPRLIFFRVRFQATIALRAESKLFQVEIA